MMILDDAQIEAQMQDIINSTWPPAKREKAMRTGLLLPELNAFFASMSDLKAQKTADRDFKLSIIAYKSALAALEKPTLELSEFVTQEMVEANIAERAAAQIIIDGATAEVLAECAPVEVIAEPEL